jgi:cytochrome c-type protein NapB
MYLNLKQDFIKLTISVFLKTHILPRGYVMKKPVFLATLAIVGSLLASVATADVQSLRGTVNLDSKSQKPILKKLQADRDPIQRDYVQQPPLVPHKVDGYRINLKSNKCLSCHSWTNYKRVGATKVSQTHFSNRNGNVQANVAARRYFCLQCHVPQVNAQPLVENTFKSVSDIKK